MRTLTRRIEDDASASPCQGEAIRRIAASVNQDSVFGN